MNQKFLLIVIIVFCCIEVSAEKVKPEITILSTMVANYLGEGEWGFSALIETSEKSILFDSGFKANTVLNNARALNIDLASVEDVVLTHFHSDHTGGLLTLRRAFKDKNPRAFSRIYVGRGFFLQRYNTAHEKVYSLSNPDFTENYKTPMAFRQALEKEGVQFIVVDDVMELAEGVFLTGPISRIHPEKNVSPGFYLKTVDGYVADTVPESQVIGIDTSEGWLLVSGCGHAGIINASEQLNRIKKQPIHMGIGGFHLFRATEKTILWTADRLNDFGYKKIVGAHCTGAYATHRLAQLLGFPRPNVSIGAIGTRVTHDMTIIPASIE